MNLTYIGSGTGSGGDKYVGLDSFGRVVSQDWVLSGTASVEEYAYTYDRDGNITEMDNVAALQIPAVHTNFDQSYTYDGLNRLVTDTYLTGVNPNQSWALDALGNMTSVTTGGTTVNRTTNAEDQLTNIGGTSLTYDDAGNLTVDENGDTLVYDAWNRVVAIKSGTLTLESYSYDGTGRRIGQTSGGTTLSLYYNGMQVAEQRTGVNYSSSGTITASYVYSPAYVNDAILRDTYSSGTFNERLYFTHDINANVTAAINTSGVVQQRMAYDAYGTIHFLTSNWLAGSNAKSIGNLFQGMFFDATTGYYFSGDSNDGRLYDVVTGRFNRLDDGGFVNGLNRYGFVEGNPITGTDPWGLAMMTGLSDGAAPPSGAILGPSISDPTSVVGGYAHNAPGQAGQGGGGTAGCTGNDPSLAGGNQQSLTDLLNEINRLLQEGTFLSPEGMAAMASPMNLQPSIPGYPSGINLPGAPDPLPTDLQQGALNVIQGVANTPSGFANFLLQAAYNMGSADDEQVNPGTSAGLGPPPTVPPLMTLASETAQARGDSPMVTALSQDLGGAAVTTLLTAGAGPILDTFAAPSGAASATLDTAATVDSAAATVDSGATAADGSTFTFRGDSSNISNVFNNGIEAKGTSTDLLAHALDSSNPPSAFVSTSQSFDVAQGFNPDQVFVIRPTGGINVNAALGVASPYPSELEVAVPEWIAPADVRGVTLANQGYSLINWNYAP